jgi:hypothetical protein
MGMISVWFFAGLDVSGETNYSTGTLIASFNGGTQNETITGESGATGDHNRDGLIITGMPPAQVWINVSSSSTNSSSGVDSSSGSPITFSFNLNHADTGKENPGGFNPGDLREVTWRLLAPNLGTTGASSGLSWSTHPGYCEWEIEGLSPGALYDLIFYGGDPSRPCSITISGYTSTTDPEGDANFMHVKADVGGMISGRWNQPTAANAISNFGGVQIALFEPAPPAGTVLIIN